MTKSSETRNANDQDKTLWYKCHIHKLSKTSLNLWNNTDFYVIVLDVDQPAFAQILSPSPLTHDYFTYCSCADDKNKAINNICPKLTKDWIVSIWINWNFSDIVLPIYVYSLVCLFINSYTQREKLILISPTEFIISPSITQASSQLKWNIYKQSASERLLFFSW